MIAAGVADDLASDEIADNVLLSIDLIQHGILSDTSTDRSPIMQAADKAAKVVEGWSDAKRDYAERVVGSSTVWTEQDLAEAKAEAKELSDYFNPPVSSPDHDSK